MSFWTAAEETYCQALHCTSNFPVSQKYKTERGKTIPGRLFHGGWTHSGASVHVQKLSIRKLYHHPQRRKWTHGIHPYFCL